MNDLNVDATKRLSILAIRLSRRERETVEELARFEKLPASTLARRLLLKEAERRISEVMHRKVERADANNGGGEAEDE